MYCGLLGRVMVVGSLGSSGSQGSASKSSSFSPGATNFGGCEWLSMALILLISASNWGSAICARSVETRKRQTSATAVLTNMKEVLRACARKGKPRRVRLQSAFNHKGHEGARRREKAIAGCSSKTSHGLSQRNMVQMRYKPRTRSTALCVPSCPLWLVLRNWTE